MTAQPTFAQDPDELFDVITEDGAPTGIVKRRADVHRDGDWHRAIHVWVYGVEDSVPFLLFNLRGRHKDTWPGLLDVTVGANAKRRTSCLSTTIRPPAPGAGSTRTGCRKDRGRCHTPVSYTH